VKALDLRIAGGDLPPDRRAAGVSEYTAYHDVQDELGRLDGTLKERAERLRDLEARRLDLTVSLAAGTRAGDPRAVLAMVRVMERRAKLFGLDAPTQIARPSGEAVPVRIVMQQDKG